VFYSSARIFFTHTINHAQSIVAHKITVVACRDGRSLAARTPVTQGSPSFYLIHFDETYEREDRIHIHAEEIDAIHHVTDGLQQAAHLLLKVKPVATTIRPIKDHKLATGALSFYYTAPRYGRPLDKAFPHGQQRV